MNTSLWDLAHIFTPLQFLACLGVILYNQNNNLFHHLLFNFLQENIISVFLLKFKTYIFSFLNLRIPEDLWMDGAQEKLV